MSSWEHFAHGADIGIRGKGFCIEEAFEMAALSLSSVVTSLEKIDPYITVHIHCEEKDVELLFYDWINALIFEMDTRKILFKKFHIQIVDGVLDAECVGQKIDSSIHEPAVDIKGATMTELKVEEINKEWIAQCVVDV